MTANGSTVGALTDRQLAHLIAAPDDLPTWRISWDIESVRRGEIDA